MTGIRPMVPADAAPLGHMHHQAWLEAFGHLLPQSYWDRWTVTDAVTTWDEILTAHCGAEYVDERFPELLEIRIVR
jgi:hypothetical protein